MWTQNLNDAMRVLLVSAQSLPNTATLDPELATYLRDGLAIDAGGSIVAVAAAALAHAQRHNFSDLVQHEAFANKAHIDDWSERLSSASLEEKLIHAMLLGDEVGRLAGQLAIPIAVIISADPSSGDVVFRFHGIRPNETPWVAGIDSYSEPVLVRVYDPICN